MRPGQAVDDAAGFDRPEALGRLDYFSASSSPETRAIARSFDACAIVVRAVKPPVSPLPPSLARPPASPTVASADPPRAPVTVPASRSHTACERRRPRVCASTNQLH
jgi:hypothetical protein